MDFFFARVTLICMYCMQELRMFTQRIRVEDSIFVVVVVVRHLSTHYYSSAADDFSRQHVENRADLDT